MSFITSQREERVNDGLEKHEGIWVTGGAFSEKEKPEGSSVGYRIGFGVLGREKETST